MPLQIGANIPLEPIPRSRSKIFEVSPGLLLMMGRGIFEIVSDPLPDDAAIYDMKIDESTGDLLVRVLSNSFPEITEGGHIPRICPQVQRCDQFRILDSRSTLHAPRS